jgi:hypothetical protein
MESMYAVDIWCIDAGGMYIAFNYAFFFHIICVSFEIDNCLIMSWLFCLLLVEVINKYIPPCLCQNVA